ncbi:MAG: Hsp20/alpha crystallin family protein [Anaerolineae bacterium]|nr:Hsp20/alpha crystallin family protein [Anaerolineae bacterium]
MSDLTRWDPISDIMSLRQAMDRLIEESLSRSGWTRRGTQEQEWRLPVDAYTTPEEVVIIASIPGVEPDDVEITLEGETLTIRGEIPGPVENVNYVLQERTYGKFSRTLTLNVPVDPDKAEATFQNGVLTLRIPKAEAIRPKVIKVTTK